MFDYNLKEMYALDEKNRNIRFLQACIVGNLEKVNLLLDNKNLNVDMYFKDTEGNDGFRWACIFKKNDIVKELLFTYDYKVSKRNLNYIVKSAVHKPHFHEYLKMIESAEIHSSLNKSLITNKISNKKSKV